MKLAVMQPYFFPYIGYWQLINSVDRFVIYDDVNFINRGWVNRNRILVNGKVSYLTVPLSHASQNKKINEICVQEPKIWQDKLVRTVALTYKRTPFFSEVFPLVEHLIRCDSTNLADYLSCELRDLSAYLGIQTSFFLASKRYRNNELVGEARILDICKQEAASDYLNLPGGMRLYNSQSYSLSGVRLRFLRQKPFVYKQFGMHYERDLSIIDVLMFNGREGAIRLLRECEYVDPIPDLRQ